MGKTRAYREALLEALADPAEAAHYLNAAKQDSLAMFLKALRNVAQAREVTAVAKKAGITRESLYRATSSQGNPTLDTLDSVLDALGMSLNVEAKAPVPMKGQRPSQIGHRYQRSKKSLSRISDQQLTLPFGEQAQLPSGHFFVLVGAGLSSTQFSQITTERIFFQQGGMGHYTWTPRRNQAAPHPQEALTSEQQMISSVAMPTMSSLKPVYMI